MAPFGCSGAAAMVGHALKRVCSNKLKKGTHRLKFWSDFWYWYWNDSGRRIILCMHRIICKTMQAKETATCVWRLSSFAYLAYTMLTSGCNWIPRKLSTWGFSLFLSRRASCSASLACGFLRTCLCGTKVKRRKTNLTTKFFRCVETWTGPPDDIHTFNAKALSVCKTLVNTYRIDV